MHQPPSAGLDPATQPDAVQPRAVALPLLSRLLQAWEQQCIRAVAEFCEVGDEHVAQLFGCEVVSLRVGPGLARIEQGGADARNLEGHREPEDRIAAHWSAVELAG